MRRVVIFLILILSAGKTLQAQDVPRMQDAFFEAEYFLLSGDYADALPYYQGIYSVMPDNTNIAYRIGLCYLNIEGKKNLAIEYLEKAAVNPASKYREGLLRQQQAPYDAIFFLGDAYRVNYMFEKVKVFGKSFRIIFVKYVRLSGDEHFAHFAPGLACNKRCMHHQQHAKNIISPSHSGG